MAQSILPSKIKPIIESFVSELKEIYGEALVSIVLYGSAASGEFTGKSSNINVAVILADASLESLAKLKKILAQHRFRLLDPIFFTEDYMKRSLDVFPVEFLDMKENHILAYGKDILGGLSVDVKNLRFQCEQELKSKLINIKRRYLRTVSASDLKDLLFKSCTSSLHIMRNLIRLKGKTPPYAKTDIINDLEREFAIDAIAFRNILNAKGGSVRLAKRELEQLFAAFVDELEGITLLVDRL